MFFALPAIDYFAQFGAVDRQPVGPAVHAGGMADLAVILVQGAAPLGIGKVLCDRQQRQ
jgi:hypothetical protein